MTTAAPKTPVSSIPRTGEASMALNEFFQKLLPKKSTKRVSSYQEARKAKR
jgi:hypothetical protein